MIIERNNYLNQLLDYIGIGNRQEMKKTALEVSRKR